MAKSTRLKGVLALAFVCGCDPDIHLGTLAGAGDRGSGGAGAAANDASGGARTGGAPATGGAKGFWRAEFELGDLSEWTSDGQGANYRSNQLSAPEITTERAHAGNQSAKVTISVVNGMNSVNYLYRQAPTPSEAYFSAWFLIPRGYTVPDWWNIVHFVGSQSGDGRDEVGLWDVDLQSTADGSLSAYVWSFEQSKRYDPPVRRVFPVGVWVELGVLFRKASDDSGHFAVYQDGVLLLELASVRTAPNDWLRWAVGSASTDITPSPAELFIDDASIAVAPRAP